MVFPSNGFFRELGVVGILGSDAFAQAVVTFDAREQIMIINYPYRPDGLKISEGSCYLSGADESSYRGCGFWWDYEAGIV